MVTTNSLCVRTSASTSWRTWPVRESVVVHCWRPRRKVDNEVVGEDPYLHLRQSALCLRRVLHWLFSPLSPPPPPPRPRLEVGLGPAVDQAAELVTRPPLRQEVALVLELLRIQQPLSAQQVKPRLHIGVYYNNYRHHCDSLHYQVEHHEVVDHSQSTKEFLPPPHPPIVGCSLHCSNRRPFFVCSAESLAIQFACN